MKTKNFLVVGLAVVLVLFLWYRFVYSSMESQASKANEGAKNAKTQVQSLQSQLKKLDGSDAKRKASADELKLAIPATPEISNFLRNVQQIRDAVGIPEAFQTITPTMATGSGSINLGITMRGSYAQVMDYINRLNSLKRLVVIDNVQMTAGAAEGAQAGGGPAGQVFAGQGGAPVIQLQLTARLLSQQPAAASVASSGSTSAANKG